MKLKLIFASLFICFGLVSFSFGAYEVGLPYYVGSYSTTIKPYGDFLTSGTGFDKKVFALDSKNFFFWNGTGLYEMLYSDRLGLEHWEGFLPYFFLCSNNFGSGATSWQDVGICDQYSINNNFDTLSTYMGGVDSDNYFIAGYDFNNALGFYFCVNTDLDKSVCFDGYNRYLADGSGWPTNDLNLGDITFYDIDSSYLGNSPFNPGGGGSSSGSSSIINTPSTMYNYYYRKGYRPNLCYGGFGLNDLVESGATMNSFSGFNAGGGATINDLYLAYSGGQTRANWYDGVYLDYRYFKEFYPDYVPDYVGKSKGLIGLGMAHEGYFRGSDRSTQDYLTFCNILFANSELADDTPLTIIDESFGDQIVSEIFEDLSSLDVDSDSPLGSIFDCVARGDCNFGGGSGSGAGGGGGSGWGTTGASVPDECKNISDASDLIKCIRSGSFRDYINNSVGSFGRSSVPLGSPGILPKYIVIGFLAFTLLYLLRK